MNPFLPKNSQEMLERVQTVSRELKAEIADLDEGLADFSPAKGEWSIKEIICHLRDVEQIFQQRMVLMLEEEEPFLRGYNPQEMAIERDYPSEKWAMVLPAFLEIHKLNLDLLSRLEPFEWFRGAIHQERGHITIYDIAETLVDHFQLHIGQIRQNKEAL